MGQGLRTSALRDSGMSFSGVGAEDSLAFWVGGSVDGLLDRFGRATSMQLIAAERHGLDASVLLDLATRMGVSVSFLASALGIPARRASMAIAHGRQLDGVALLALLRLVHRALEVVAQVDIRSRNEFDACKWLGQWLALPQPALGGRAPAAFMDTPTGRAVVLRTLGALCSDAYQ